MKLVVLLSIVALVACDYPAPQPETPTDAYGPPDNGDAVEETSAPLEPAKSFFKFNSVYRGAFPPARFPPASFLAPSFTPSFTPPTSFDYPPTPLKATLNLAASPQAVLPPISQIVPPQLSQVVPPVSQILPPIFGSNKPSLPSPTFPPHPFPPVANPLFGKFGFPHYSSLFPQYSSAFPYTFPSTFASAFPSTLPSTFPSTFSFPPSPFFPAKLQKQPSKPHADTLSTSYGPPVSGPADPAEPSGAAESSAPFEPSAPVSFPYEPAAPEAPEPAAPHQPSQEYGVPSIK